MCFFFNSHTVFQRVEVVSVSVSIKGTGSGSSNRFVGCSDQIRETISQSSIALLGQTGTEKQDIS